MMKAVKRGDAPRPSQQDLMHKALDCFKNGLVGAGLDLLDAWVYIDIYTHDKLAALSGADRYTPLMQLCYWGHLDLVKMLVWFYDADPNKRHQCSKGHKNAIEIAELGENGADTEQVIAFLRSPQAVPKQLSTTDMDEQSLPFSLSELNSAGENLFSGATMSYIFTDRYGMRWLFKPQELWRAHVDIATSKLMRMVGLPAPLTFLVRDGLEGRQGSLQRMFGVQARELGCNFVEPMFNGQDFDPGKLEPGHTAFLQMHDAFDWLIGNMDGHLGNFIRLDGDFNPFLTILAIDKGQAFKYWRRGWPVLADGTHRSPHDPDWEPEGTEHPNTVYAKMLTWIRREGRKPAGWADLRRDDAPANRLRNFIRRLEAIPDDVYIRILTPYADGCAGAIPGFSKAEFLHGVTEHKNRMLHLYTELHQTLP
eukprot:TRINITY_DN107962_c0_g1_i1.p1 TRINITY_DN107962_c0_g1~~TRINITY_DN107962_c0_g1_i1.p1  ORF type:complete len:461 (-),score=73.21 TRINITY_DN107962_c0_g1_i1:180-1448(-)